MRTETIKIYKFDELSPEAQEKAIENLRYEQVESDHWFDPIVELQTEDLKSLWLHEPKISFSGFSSQACEGASFTGVADSTFIQNAFSENLFNVPSDLVDVLTEGDLEVDIIFCRNAYSGNYVHEHTVSTKLVPDWAENLDLIQKYKASLIELEKNIEVWRYAKCRVIYDELYKYYDQLTSDAGVKAYIQCHELEFYGTGETY